MRQKIIGRNIAVESILFQDSSFFKELTAIFKGLKDVSAKEMAECELVTVLNKAIKHNTGINFNVIFDESGPYVEFPQIDKNNVLVNSFIKNYVTSHDGLKLINDAGKNVRGTVNLKTSQVTGIFTEPEFKMHYPISMVKNDKFIPEELAAVILHEIGHIFTLFEFLSRSITTNQVLSGVARELDKSSTPEEREYILTTAKKALNLPDLDVKELAKSNSKEVVELVIITNETKKVESELGSNIYDFSTWEYLSDQFAARHGAGRYLVTSLEKIYKSYWSKSFRSMPAFVFFEALKLVLFFSGVFTHLGLLLILIDGDGDGTYDVPGARFKRIRDQVVRNLTDKTLSKDDVERLTADLAVIDNVLKEVDDKRQFFGVLWDVISPTARRAKNQKDLQQDLENLMHNQMFEKAASILTFTK